MDDKYTTYAAASFAKEFETFCTSNSLKLTLGALDSKADQNQADYINLKIATDVNKMTAKEIKITCDLSIFVHCILNPSLLFKFETLKGKVTSFLYSCFVLRNQGFSDSNDSVIETFKLVGKVHVVDFSNKDQATRARESVITVRYETTILED